MCGGEENISTVKKISACGSASMLGCQPPESFARRLRTVPAKSCRSHCWDLDAAFSLLLSVAFYSPQIETNVSEQLCFSNTLNGNSEHSTSSTTSLRMFFLSHRRREHSFSYPLPRGRRKCFSRGTISPSRMKPGSVSALCVFCGCRDVFGESPVGFAPIHTSGIFCLRVALVWGDRCNEPVAGLSATFPSTSPVLLRTPTTCRRERKSRRSRANRCFWRTRPHLAQLCAE